MRMNKYLASTLFTGLFVTASVFSPAQGQEQSLQPQGAWALTKVDRSEQGGNSYCTLSRKYDQDVVLSLGRNQTEEYSLAVDFQKPTFEKGKSLKINLQPGPGQIRAYDMMPTSDKALVIRLGWDTGFFDALNGSQQMKIKIADKSYAFAMPEVAKGQKELQDCMEGLKTAKAGAAPQTTDVLAAEASGSKGFDAGKMDDKPTAAAAAAPMQTAKAHVPVQAAPEEKSFLQSFADSITAQEPKIRGDEAVPKRKNFGSESDDAKPTEKAVVADNAAPTPEFIKRPPSVAQAAPVIAASSVPKIPTEADNGKSAEIAALQKRLSDANAQNAALKQKVAETPEDKKRAESLEAEKKALQDKIAALEVENARKVKPEDVALAQARAKELETKNAVLEAEKLKLAKPEDVAKAEAKAKELEAKNAALEAEKAKLAKPEDMAKAEGRAKELEIKNTQLEESLRAAQTRIAEAAINTESKALRQIADLEVKLEAAKKDNTELAKQLESMKVQQEDGRLATVAGDWDLEQATKRFNEAEREIKRLGQQLEQERMSCNREKAEIEQMLFDPAVADQKQIERLSVLEKELTLAKEKISNQQKLVQGAVDEQLSAKTKAIESEKLALGQQVAALQQSLTQKDQALATANAQPKADPAATAQQIAAEVAKVRAEADAKMAELQKTLVAKDAELVAAKAAPKVDPAATAQQIASEVAKNKVASDAEIASLKQAIVTKDQQIAAAQAAPRTDPAILKQVADMQVTIANMQKEAQLLRDQNVILKSESDRLHLQLADAANNGGARADQVASMRLEVDEVKKQMALKDTQNLTYQNQIASLQQETTQLKNRLAAGSVQADNAAQVDNLNSEIQSLKRQISDMEKRKMPDRSASLVEVAAIAPAAGPSVYTQAVSASVGGYDAGGIKGLLQKAGISTASVKKAPGGGMPGAENFTWIDGGKVKGLASVKAVAGDFDGMVNQFIAQQKSHCGGGDFASMPSPSNTGAASKRIALYEVACVNGGDSTSSSIIFFEDQGQFIAISNEIDAADMDIAMDSRDKIAGFVRNL